MHKLIITPSRTEIYGINIIMMKTIKANNVIICYCVATNM